MIMCGNSMRLKRINVINIGTEIETKNETRNEYYETMNFSACVCVCNLKV